MSPAAIAGIVIAALLLGYGAYAYLTDSWPLAPMATVSPSPSASVSPSGTPDPTAGWKTYSDTALGISFRYPAHYQVDPQAKSYFIDPTTKEKVGIVYRSDISGQSAQWSYEHWFDQNATASVSIDGYQANKFAFSYCDGPGCGTPQVAFVIIYQDHPLAIEFTGDLEMSEIENQILSTFKFTDPTAGWKTYTNAQYGFEIKYPPSWQIYPPGPSRVVVLADSATPPPADSDIPVNGVWIATTRGPATGTPTTVAERSALTTPWEKGFGDAFWKDIFILTTPGLHVTQSALSSDAQNLEDQILSTFKFTQ